ncbi:hypothetical protein BJ742DRAFT_820598 [Cladochytrium replicatum]|nr:hypothetical protein BJ742DRAFT_820598 [Cladochytrium replicatum]
MMATSSTAMCDFFRTHQGYMGRVVWSDEEKAITSGKKSELPSVILIVDSSGSMGGYTKALITDMLPAALEQCGYTEDAKVTVITFDSVSEVLKADTIGEIKKVQNIRSGGTNMAGVFPILLTKLDGLASVRILTISDGYVFDTADTMKNASDVASTMKDRDTVISSMAIRFGTGGQADTRALSSVLQLDNRGDVVALEDIQATTPRDSVVEKLVQMIQSDNLTETRAMEIEGQPLSKFPWSARNASSLPLRVGDNFFWCDAVPTRVVVDGREATLKVSEEYLPQAQFNSILHKSIKAFLQRAKVLKVVNSDDSLSDLQRMVAYFDGLERGWVATEMQNEGPTSTGLEYRSVRLRRLLEKTQLSIRHQLSTIMNDSLVAKLNAAQAADYLRSVDLNKTSKGLAKRAASAEGAFDFDEVSRKEVRVMHKHLSELDAIDDTNHLVSFYSRATTLEGIKAVCKLEDDGLLDGCSTTMILELFNVVGIPCSAAVGDYSDPMTYRLTDCFMDCHVSLADVIVCSADGSTKLVTPGTHQEIVNVIPVFEDRRIATFLRKYAPTLLEYLASVGMRRLVLDVPMTFGYTCIAGVWKMLEILGSPAKRSEIAVRNFLYLMDQLPFTVGRAFAHTLPLLDKPNGDADLSYDLLHNGVTNMICALQYGIEKRKSFDMGKLLRALYSFEVWQMVRKRYRNQNDPPEVCAQAMLRNLFKVDFDKWKIPTRPLFEEESKEHDESWPVDMDSEYANALLKDCWFVDFMTYIPTLFSIAVDSIAFEEKVAKFKNLGEFDDAHKATTLGVQDLAKFKHICVMQALVYTTKKSRFDEDTAVPVIPEPASERMTTKTINETLKGIYMARYAVDVKNKSDEELKQLVELLTRKLVEATTVDEFAKVLKEGVSIGCRTHALAAPSTAGYDAVEAALLSTDPVPLQAEKLVVLISGEHDKLPVWNNGNMMLFFKKEWEETFKRIGAESLWDALKEQRKEKAYVYRELKNRHGHGNDLLSYWAMGYPTMEAMKSAVSADEFGDYEKKHPFCCGCDNGVYIGRAN